jgi:spermidine/putrescine transport system ATP-binding protein
MCIIEGPHYSSTILKIVSQTGEPIVELRGVVKRFGERVAVDRVSLAIPPGQFYSLLGPSGCGKSTTLRLIAGFERPDEGEVLLDGVVVNDLPPYRRKVSTVFQSYALFPHLTVAGNVGFGLRQARVAEAEVRRRVGEALEMVQLPGYGDRSIQQLSGGEKQRVALARSMVLEPDVLLLDEPLAALDQKLRRDVRLELKRLQRAAGITFLFITHDQEEALVLSDRIAVMHQGRLEQVGTPEEIYRRPATRFVAGFIGSSNYFRCWVVGVGSWGVEVRTEGGQRLVAPNAQNGPAPGEQVGLLIRPESVQIADGAAPEGAQKLRGRVLHGVFLGSHHEVTVEIEPGLLITTRSGAVPEPGATVELWWRAEDGLILQ